MHVYPLNVSARLRHLALLGGVAVLLAVLVALCAGFLFRPHGAQSLGAPPATVAYASPFTRVTSQHTVTVEGTLATEKSQCRALTDNGKGPRCKRPPVSGSLLCRQHKKMKDEGKPVVIAGESSELPK